MKHTLHIICVAAKKGGGMGNDMRFKRKPNIKEILCLSFLALMVSVFIAAAATGLWTVKVHTSDRYYDLDLPVSLSDAVKDDDGYYSLEETEYNTIINVKPTWEQPKLFFSLKYVVEDETGEQLDKDIVHATCLNEAMEPVSKELLIKRGELTDVLVPEGVRYVKLRTVGTTGEAIKFSLCRIGSRPVYNTWGELWGYTALIFLGLEILIVLLEILLGITGRNVPWDMPIHVMSYIYEKVRWALTRCRILSRQSNKSPIIFIVGCLSVFILIYQITYFKSSEAKKCLMFLMMVLCTTGCGYGAKLKWGFGNRAEHTGVYDRTKGGIKVDLLSIAFFWFSIMLYVSDVVVKGEWFGAGFMYLVMFGFMAWCLSFCSDSYRLIRYLKIGILLNFAYIIFQCVFTIHEIRTWGTEYYYSGINQNSALFGVNIVSAFVVLVSDIDEMLEKGKITFRYVLASVLLGVAILFLWAAQARTMFLIEILIGLVFFGKIFVCRRRYGNKLMFIGQLAILAVCIVVGWNAVLWGINNIALKGTEYHLKVTMLTGMEVYAGDGSRIFDKFKNFGSLSSFTTGRFGMWITYLKNMNLWGHVELEYCPNVDRWITPHNSILWYMYEYGAIIVVPYLLMVGAFIIKSIKYAKRNLFKSFNAMLPVYTSCMLLILGLTETFEDVFRWYTPWVLLYMVVIYLMRDEKKEICCDENAASIKKNNTQSIMIVTVLFVFLKYILF